MKAQSILFLFEILTIKNCCIKIYQTSLLFKIMKTVIYRIAKLTTFLTLAHLKLNIWRIKRIIQWTIWIICKMNKIMTIKMSSINNQVISIIKFNRINSLWINIKRLHFNIKISLLNCNSKNRIIISQLILSIKSKAKIAYLKTWKMKQYQGFNRNFKSN